MKVASSTNPVIKPTPKPRKKKDISKKNENTTTKTIKDIIQHENNIDKYVDEVHNSINNDEKFLLNHLNDQTEDPYSIIESYFEGKHLDRLVRHQIESYNHFVNYQIQRTIQMFNPVKIRSENDYIEEKDKYFLEVMI